MKTVYRSKNSSRSIRLSRRATSIAVATIAILWRTVTLSAANLPLSGELPSGEHVVSGQASVTRSGSAMEVRQTTDRAILNWQSFNIGSKAQVDFFQPRTQSVALNRVLSADPSSIYGTLRANGGVFLVNPSGIIFGKGSSVNVGSLVASTMSISDGNFNSGNYRFQRNGSTASIINKGKIQAAEGGLVALLGTDIHNDGLIEARLGSVILATGEAATLTLSSDNLYSIAVDPSTVATLIDNKGIIQTDGGTVLMKASVAGDLVSSAINTSGVVRARSIGEKNGVITIMGDMEHGTVQIGGVLDASAPESGNGGFIETSAAKVRIADGTSITTAAPYGSVGTWLIDPTNFTIADGSAAQTASGIGATTLQNSLASTDVTIATSSSGSEAGDINVNAPVSWSSHNLSLQAKGDIDINAVMTASGSSILDIKAGYSTPGNAGGTYDLTKTVKCNLTADGFTGRVDFPGRSGNGLLTINGDAYTLIKDLGTAGSTTAKDLQGMSGNLTGNYALGTNIDASSTSTWNSGKGWTPVSLFSGRFDGLGHTITGLYSNHISDSLTFTGLFGSIHNRWDADGGYVLRNIGVECADINGYFVNGALAGAVFSSSVTNVYATGSVHATYYYTGGLFGTIEDVTVSNSFNKANVTSSSASNGGIAGGATRSNIINSFNSGNISGTIWTGGLTGALGEAADNIVNSYNTGNVSGTDQVGGLVGQVGWVMWYGLYGFNVANATSSITNSFNTGRVTGTTNVGGLVGLIQPSFSSTIKGHSSNHDEGKTVFISTSITGCYWDKTTAGISTSPAGTALTTAQMEVAANFSGWDFTNTWRIYEGLSRPVLRSFQSALTVTAADQTITYNRTAYSGGNGVTYSIAGATPSGTLTWSGNSQGAVNAGTYALTPVGLLSDQRYNISPVSGALTIKPASLTVTGLTALDKTYNANTTATLSGTASIAPFSGDVVTLGGTPLGTFAEKNVGTGKAVTVTGSSISGTDAGNYTLLQQSGLTADITRASLMVTGLTANSKIYDATTNAALGGTASIAPFSGDAVILGGTPVGTFADKNVGTGKTVTLTGSSISGSDAGNYTLLQQSGLTADITRASLMVTGLTANSKIYDATTNAALGGTASIAPFSGDAVILGGTPVGTFADKNVGTGKTVTLTGSSISGEDAGNYTLLQQSGLTADIIYPTANSGSSWSMSNAGSILSMGGNVANAGSIGSQFPQISIPNHNEQQLLGRVPIRVIYMPFSLDIPELSAER